MRSFIATAVTLATAAVAVPAGPLTKFQLSASGNSALEGWAVVNAHISAGTNAIQIQRPAAFQSDESYLDHTTLNFALDGVPNPFGVLVPDVPAGGIANVTAVMGEQTPGFGFDPNFVLTFNGNTEGWWACPVAGIFTLAYGVNPTTANLPAGCQSITLSASAVSAVL